MPNARVIHGIARKKNENKLSVFNLTYIVWAWGTPCSKMQTKFGYLFISIPVFISIFQLSLELKEVRDVLGQATMYVLRPKNWKKVTAKTDFQPDSQQNRTVNHAWLKQYLRRQSWSGLILLFPSFLSASHFPLWPWNTMKEDTCECLYSVRVLLFQLFMHWRRFTVRRDHDGEALYWFLYL